MPDAEEYKAYMTGFIKQVCDTCGPRITTTEADHAGCVMVRDECQKYTDSPDDVLVEEFSCASRAYPGGLVRVGRVLFTIGFVLFPTVYCWGTIIACLLGVVVVVVELMVFIEFIDPFYKHGTSYNVFGRLKPAREPRFLLLFLGHEDSAFEVPFAARFGAKTSRLSIGAISLGFYAIILASCKLVYMALGGAIIYQWTILAWTPFEWAFFIPFIAWGPFFYYVAKNLAGGKPVLGANDDLSGVAVSLAIGKYFSEHRPDYVEIWFGSVGAEEAGQRGSRRFGAAHVHDEFMRDHGYLIALDSVSGPSLAILQGEGMRIPKVAYTPEIVAKLLEAAEAYKAECPPGEMPDYQGVFATFGGTDACSLVKSGLKAGGIAAGDPKTMYVDNWHQASDTPENINGSMLWTVFNVCRLLVEKKDEEYKTNEK